MTGKDLFLFVFCLIPFTGVKAQNFYVYPQGFVQFTNSVSFTNPASSGLENKWGVNFLHSFYSGLSNNIGVNLLEADYSLETGKHTPGIVFYSEQETEYLRRTKAMVRYAYHLKVTDKFTLSAGASFGFFNYFVRATSSSAGASSFAPDGYVGIWGNTKKFNIGISSGQIFQGEVSPVNKTYRLGRYYSFYSDKKLYLNYSIAMLIAGECFYAPDNTSFARFATSFTISDNLVASFFYSTKKSYGISVGIIDFSVISINGDLFFAYQNPYGSLNALNASRFEVNLKIYKKNESDY